jgi:hypothetical protein
MRRLTLSGDVYEQMHLKEFYFYGAGSAFGMGCLIRLYVPHAVQSPRDENIIYGLTAPGLDKSLHVFYGYCDYVYITFITFVLISKSKLMCSSESIAQCVMSDATSSNCGSYRSPPNIATSLLQPAQHMML